MKPQFQYVLRYSKSSFIAFRDAESGWSAAEQQLVRTGRQGQVWLRAAGRRPRNSMVMAPRGG
jgi:hypothetical protein